MSDVKWIKICTEIFDDESIKLIEEMPEGDAIIVIWFKLLIQAGKNNDCGYIYFKKDIPYTDEMLATVFKRPLNVIRLAIQVFKQFGMIEILDTQGIFISNWEKHQNLSGMEQIKEYNRLAKRKQRAKLKELQNIKLIECQGQVKECHETDKDIDIEIDKDKDKFIKNENEKKVKKDPYLNSHKTLFESEYKKIWGQKPILIGSDCSKILELASDIENFDELVPTVIQKLKKINFKEIGFKPSASWLLKDNNFAKVANGEFDINAEGSINDGYDY